MPLDDDALQAIVAWVKSRPPAATEHLLLSLPRTAQPGQLSTRDIPPASLPAAPKRPTCPKTAIIGNRVANMRKGIALFSSGIYNDNTVGGATTPFTGANAAGATNLSF